MFFKSLISFGLALVSLCTVSAQPAAFEKTPAIDTVAIASKNRPEILNYKDGKFALRNENASGRRRFWRSELLIGGTELAGMGVLMLLPKRITKWEDDYIKRAAKNFRESWTKGPVWDKDDFTMNYVAHPLVGSYYYNAMRSQGARPWPAFLFSTGQSVIWEFCIEGFAERPSVQDLLITSTTGALIGEAIHRSTLRMGRNGFNTLEKIVVSIINPLFILNNKFSYRLHEQHRGNIYSLHK